MGALSGLNGLSGLSGIFGGISEINVVCPAITPTLGPELLTNPGLEAPYTAGVAANWSKFGAPTVAEENVIIHGGASSQKITRVNNADRVLSSNFSPTANNWYQVTGWLYSTTAGANNVELRSGSATNSGNYMIERLATGSAWTQKVGTFRATAATGYVGIWVNNAGTVAYLDDASAKNITFASMLTYLGNRSLIPGTYTCTPTVANGTQCGIVLAYADASNFVLLIVNRIGTTDNAQLWKCIAGTWSSVITGTITYGATNELAVTIAGTNYTVYYNSIQVGGTTIIADAGLGTQVYGFNSYAGNSVGTVTTESVYLGESGDYGLYIMEWDLS